MEKPNIKNKYWEKWNKCTRCSRVKCDCEFDCFCRVAYLTAFICIYSFLFEFCALFVHIFFSVSDLYKYTSKCMRWHLQMCIACLVGVLMYVVYVNVYYRNINTNNNNNENSFKIVNSKICFKIIITKLYKQELKHTRSFSFWLIMSQIGSDPIESKKNCTEKHSKAKNQVKKQKKPHALNVIITTLFANRTKIPDWWQPVAKYIFKIVHYPVGCLVGFNQITHYNFAVGCVFQNEIVVFTINESSIVRCCMCACAYEIAPTCDEKVSFFVGFCFVQLERDDFDGPREIFIFILCFASSNVTLFFLFLAKLNGMAILQIHSIRLRVWCVCVCVYMCPAHFIGFVCNFIMSAAPCRRDTNKIDVLNTIHELF